jgi:hypothetical protein
MKIGEVNITYPNYFRVNISRCTEGVYLRWWYNGWHYYNFTNGYDISMNTESMDTQITQMFSVISRIEHPTKLKAEYSYKINIDCIQPQNVAGFTGLLMAEKVEQYEDSIWREVEITRGSHIIREDNSPGYRLEFEVTRKDLPNTSSVYQKSLYLYIGDTLCDMDEDEVIPVNKQTNDIAELKDRQSDFTASFKIRKTRAMRTLFELSGEVSSSTTFPYQNQTCKLVQDGIEMITHGHLVLDLVDDQYYHCSIYSGNLSLFTLIGNLKITDIEPLTSPDQLDHYWDISTMALHSISPEMDYVYPMCEPSDDAGMNPMLLAGNTTELYGGWIWPFVKVSVLWDELFANAAYTVNGNILNDDAFNRLYLPIASRNVNKEFINKYLYSLYWIGNVHYTGLQRFAEVDTVVINGDANFGLGFYRANFTATYKFRIEVQVAGGIPDIRLYSNFINRGSFTLTGTSPLTYEIEYAATIGEWLTFYSAMLIVNYLGYSISVVEITDAKLEYGNYVSPRFNLPDMTQVDFIKMICNMFALIPEVSAKDMTVKFWNYSELYDNIALARDWSAYLSEREDEAEFKFGDYAQYNYLKYKESDDVLKDNGTGIMIVDDETLTLQKDALKLDISTCDEVTIAFTDPVATSRIAFNDWYDDAGLYKENDSIDPRIVYIKEATGKELILWDDVDLATGLPTGNHVHIPDPLMATSIDIAFSALVYHYGSLSRMLTKTNLRRCKFNLPVYEVAGLKHYIPIYLSQYQAYFYVNKINNYVPGKLCIIDLIKL